MARSLKEILNEGNPNKVDMAIQQARLGTILGLARRYIEGTVTAGILTLPEDARAAVVLSANVTAGTTLGPKTPAVPAATAAGTPATTLVTTSATGHILFNIATDAVTAAEVEYMAEEGQIFEDFVPVASNVATPLAGRQVKRLLEAQAITGTVTGTFTVDQRGTAPATLHAAAQITGAGVAFQATDAVTSCRLKYIAAPGQGTAIAPAVPALTTADRNF